ncbi:MAG: hypothetical protein ACP5J5_03805 [Dissulfurimicrobium sp.]
MQNPSDPDSGYDGHKGKGCQAQIAGTYSRQGYGESGLSLITHVEVELAHVSDADALYKAIKDEHGLSFHTS